MSTIGDRIKEKRNEAGMTQLELANKLSVTDRAVSKWEQNQGNPDISILPRIAEIFNVSLDYLMTGAESKKEIVIMSKMEYCAKNDDPSMIKTLPSGRDENGKSLIDYAKQYNSKKVLKALIDNNSYQNYYENRLQHSLPAKIAIEIMLTCIPLNKEIQVIKEVFNVDIRETDDDFIKALNRNDYSKENVTEIVCGFKQVFELLVKEYSNLSKMQKEYYFNLKENEVEGTANCWFNAYPFFVEYAIAENNKELYDKLLKQIEIHNAWVDSSIDAIRKQHYRDFEYQMQFFHGKKVYLHQSTLDYLISKKDYKLAYRVNLLLREPHTKREFDLLEMEDNTTATEKEKEQFRCVDYHMIVLEEIEKLRDLKLIKTLLDNNYVNYYEMVYKLLKTNKKELYKFFIDNNLLELANHLMNSAGEKLLHESWVYFNNTPEDELKIKQTVIIKNESRQSSKNDKFISYKELANFSTIDIYNVDVESEKTDKNKLIECFELFKNNIFEKIKSIVEAEEKEKQDKIERAKLVKGLTREYFEGLLSSDNEKMEMVFVIQLCSLFDAILRFDYKCDASDFYGRMKQFFDNGPKSRDCDDGWGYMTLDTEYENQYVKPWNDNCELMNKLRIKRNSMVHPESDERADLNKDELKRCLEFVFKVNGGTIVNG